MNKLKSFLLNEQEENRNCKMMNKLHQLDLTIEQFIQELESEVNDIDDNPMFTKKCHQLIAEMSKEYAEFMAALRSIVHAIDRKMQIVPFFDAESKIRDIRSMEGEE
jgi:hypothetical protein